MNSKLSDKYDLIIFDCDGTLVDSEYLNNKVSSDLLIEFGLKEYTPERCVAEFAGTAWSNIKQTLEDRHDVEIPRSLIDNYMRLVDEKMEQFLQPIEGMLDFVVDSKKHYKIAVGSNGMRSNVVRSLELQGFLDHFSDDMIFTKVQVRNPKPAPDLFFFAAANMDVAPERCLVIEDSPTGTKAGVSAGMDVLGFTATAHDVNAQEKVLFDAGASAVFADIIHMRDYLGL
ncbi:MAG: HAD-IA family hydrolase [Alphaproteobacteria bacterium]|nr:HAD-IA family hydrolase [Alphaproteobacteria bacterium]